MGRSPSDDDVEGARRTRSARPTKNKAALAHRGAGGSSAERLDAPALEARHAERPAHRARSTPASSAFDGRRQLEPIADFPGRGAGIVLVVGSEANGAGRRRRAARGDRACRPPTCRPSSPTCGWSRPTVRRGPTRVQPIRDSDLARTVSTVDDLDQPEGPTTVVLAIADLFLIPPIVGHYGYGAAHRSLLPDPVNAREPPRSTGASAGSSRRSPRRGVVGRCWRRRGRRRRAPTPRRRRPGPASISLPNVDVGRRREARTPNLDRLFEESAVGTLVTNGVAPARPRSPSGYVTLGAGARAVAAPTARPADRASASTSPSARDPAGVVFRTRTGTRPATASCTCRSPTSSTTNDGELYGAEVGLLGDELAPRRGSAGGDRQRRRQRPEHARRPVLAVRAAPRSLR